jgi:rod shape-determining protein MreC
MEWRSALFSREKRAVINLVIAIVISLAIILAGDPVTDFIGNVNIFVFYYPFYKLKNSIGSLTQTAEEAESLRASLVELSTNLQIYNETLEENRRLRSLLGFVPPPGFTILPTEIIGVRGSTIPNTVLINKGERDSIYVDQTVINRNGLAGRAANVMADYSVVYLLTEPQCRVAARIKRSREQGIIRYSLSRGMFLDNLPQKGDVSIGDTIITSGLGGIFPEGLVIGTVTNINSPEREFFYRIDVNPAVNFNGLDELYILIRED